MTLTETTDRTLRGAAQVQCPREPQAATDLTALRMLAEMFSDYQKLRVASGNRVAHGGVDPEVFATVMGSIDSTEAMLKKALVGEYRRAVSPALRDWQSKTLGLGAHTFALLIGLLGHPRHANPKHWVETGPAKAAPQPTTAALDSSRPESVMAHPEPKAEARSRVLVTDPPFSRTLAQLWAYCGVGSPERRPRKGMTQEETFACGRRRDIGKVLHVIAEGCMKQRSSPYRSVYDDARVEYSTREGWSLLHQHNAALRRVKKEVLRDLWTVSA